MLLPLSAYSCRQELSFSTQEGPSLLELVQGQLCHRGFGVGNETSCFQGAQQVSAGLQRDVPRGTQEELGITLLLKGHKYRSSELLLGASEEQKGAVHKQWLEEPSLLSAVGGESSQSWPVR